MTTTKKKPATLLAKKTRRRIRDQRVLWLAQDIYARFVVAGGIKDSLIPTRTSALAALEAAEVFFEVATPRKKRK